MKRRFRARLKIFGIIGASAAVLSGTTPAIAQEATTGTIAGEVVDAQNLAARVQW